MHAAEGDARGTRGLRCELRHHGLGGDWAEIGRIGATGGDQIIGCTYGSDSGNRHSDARYELRYGESRGRNAFREKTWSASCVRWPSAVCSTRYVWGMPRCRGAAPRGACLWAARVIQTESRSPSSASRPSFARHLASRASRASLASRGSRHNRIQGTCSCVGDPLELKLTQSLARTNKRMGS